MSADHSNLSIEKNQFKLPIKNNLVFDFSDLSIRPKSKNDNWDFECPVNFLNEEETKSYENAERFFESLFADSEIREYARTICGLCLTGFLDFKKFIIFYGTGNNGKTVLLNIIRNILTTNLSYNVCSSNIEMNFGINKNNTRCYFISELSPDTDFDYQHVKHLTPKMILHTNEKLKYNNEVLTIPFETTFCNNPIKPNEQKTDTIFTDDIQTKYLSEVFSYLAVAVNRFIKNDFKFPNCHQMNN